MVGWVFPVLRHLREEGSKEKTKLELISLSLSRVLSSVATQRVLKAEPEKRKETEERRGDERAVFYQQLSRLSSSLYIHTGFQNQREREISREVLQLSISYLQVHHARIFC